MRLRSLIVGGALAILAAAVACTKTSPTRPSDVENASPTAASVTDARTGATIVAARPLSPAANASFKWTEQPITLTITNGVTTGSSPLTYTFEVARDAGFAQKDYTKENVAAGSAGTTSVVLDKLSGSRTYYWRVRVSSASTAGPYSAIRSFTVGPEVVLGTPVLASPINGASSFLPVMLTIINVSRTGPAGPITYKVDIAADQNFTNILFTTEAAEQGSGQTSVTAAVSGLTPGKTYYWRARAADATNHITTPYSSTASFVVQTFNFATAKIWDNPPDVGSWPVGAKITSVEFTGSSMRVDFDRRDGPNRWPDVVPPGFEGPLEYTLGLCLNIQSQWNCSAVVQFWYGRSLDDTAPPSNFWYEWWYNPGRWGPMTNYRPQEGETVGVFVAAGDLRQRFFTLATCPRVCEVSNVVLVPFTTGAARYDY